MANSAARAARQESRATALDTEFTPRPRPVRLDDGRRRLDDRVGHLHRLGRHGADHRQPRLAARRRGSLTGAAHRRRRALLRRAGRDDAARGRTVRLPARGVLAAVGIPLRLDAVPGHPDRHDRRGLRRLRPLLRRARPVDRRRSATSIAPVHLSTGLRAVAVDDAARRHPADRAAHVDEHARPRIRPDHPERLHDRQDRRAARADPRRRAARLEQRRPCPTTSATSGRRAARSRSCRG